MAFYLKPKKYDLRYLLGMPLACEPLCTIGVVAQKVLTGVVNVLWVLVEAEFIDKAVRLVTGGETLAGLLPLLAAMLFIVAWKRMGYSFGRILTRRIEVSAVYQMSLEAVKKRGRLKFKLIEDEKVWELSNRISRDMKKNVWSMTQHTCNFLVGLVRIIGVFLIIFAQSIGLGVGCLLLSMPVLIFSVISGKKTYKAYKEAAVFARRGEYLQSTMTNRESVQERALFSYVDYVNKRWQEQMAEYRKICIKTDAQKEVRNGVSTVMTNTIATIMVCFLIMELSRGNVTVGIFIALSKAIYEMIDLMHNNIGQSLVTIARYAAYMKDLTVFANMEEQEDADSLPEKPPVFESLEFRHVTFRYPGTEREILKDFSLKMEAGRHYAFVGENGAGKTTITKLLTGLYDEYQGEILLNGRELREYTQGQLKGIFTGVYQDFARYYDTVANNILLKSELVEIFLRFISMTGYIGMLLLLFYYLIRGRVDIAAFAAILSSLDNISDRLDTMFRNTLPRLTDNIGSAENYMAFMDLPERKAVKEIPEGKRVSFCKVSFAYPGNREPALHQIDLDIKEGETIAIVGENGAGKSTFAKLLLGLYCPTEGRVEIDGVDTREIAPGNSAGKLSAVFQNFQKYKMSLGENVFLSDSGHPIDEKRITHSLNRAGLDEGDGEFAQGLDTMLSREFGGTDLSGGQWQRLSIARGLYRQHNLIVLDEPTAAIDPLKETEIYQRFAESAKNKTAVIITHRLGSAKIADRIVVLDKGRIAEQGTHEELLTRHGIYSEMYHEQAKWYT